MVNRIIHLRAQHSVNGSLPVETIVSVRVLDIHNLASGRHMARHSFVHRESENKDSLQLLRMEFEGSKTNRISF